MLDPFYLFEKLTSRTATVISIILCVLVFGSLGGYLAYNYWQGFSREQTLATKGITTTAVLDKKYIEVTRRLNNIETEKRYDVIYKFNVNGKAYEGKSSLKSVPTEEAAKVIFDPNDPTNNRLEGSRETVDDISGFIGTLIVGLVMIAILKAASTKKNTRT